MNFHENVHVQESFVFDLMCKRLADFPAIHLKFYYGFSIENARTETAVPSNDNGSYLECVCTDA